MERRSRAGVVVDILTEALSGAPKTKLMYRTNLNILRFETYLSELIKYDLVATTHNSSGRVLYKTTKKGKELVKMLEKAKQYIPNIL